MSTVDVGDQPEEPAADITISLDDTAEILDEPSSDAICSPLENIDNLDHLLEANTATGDSNEELNLDDTEEVTFSTGEGESTLSTPDDSAALVPCDNPLAGVITDIDLESPMVTSKPIVEHEVIEGVYNLHLEDDIAKEMEKANLLSKDGSLEWPEEEQRAHEPTSAPSTSAYFNNGENENPVATGDVSSYFKSTQAVSSDNTGAEFFDQISSQPSVVQPESKPPVETVHAIPPRTRTISENSQEPTSISFDTEAKERLKKIASTDSVSKYFAGSGEADGKNFFDTFAGGLGSPVSDLPNELVKETAEEHHNIPASPRNIPTTPPLPPGVVPQTPPIPTAGASQPAVPLPQTPQVTVAQSPAVTQATPVTKNAVTPPLTLNTSVPPLPSPIHHPSVTTSPTQPTAPPTPPILGEPSPGAVSPTHQLPADAVPVFRQTSTDDPFSASLQMSSSDSMHDAWIPSEATRQLLVSMATSGPGSVVLEDSQLTRPGLLIDSPQGDPIKELVRRHLGEEQAAKRQSLQASDVTQNEAGLQRLIGEGCSRSAVDLTGVLLTNFGQGSGKAGQQSLNTPTTLQLWFCRLALLMKLRLHSVAETECAAFGNLDQPDLYYEFYQEQFPGRRGSLVPFGLRLLHAELPHYLGKSQESLDRLYYIHAIVNKILENLASDLSEDGSAVDIGKENREVSTQLWKKRELHVLYSISNILLGIKDYTSSIQVLQKIITKDEQKKAEILNAIGRIYLQMGHLSLAEQQFELIKNVSEENTKHSQSRDYVNRGFIHLGKNAFQEAFESFHKATEIDPDNAVAVNNMAVCALYTGKLTVALDILEKLVRSDPKKYLQDGILFNLCTLHELESSRAIEKKQHLLELVSQFKGNGFNAACLKMA